MRKFALCFLAVAVVSGCNCGGDPCDPNSDLPRCEGNVVASCPPPGVDQFLGANRWVRNDCGAEDKTCVQIQGDAFCALSSEPNPACDGGVEQVCESTQAQLGCYQGYAYYRFPCLSCEATDAGVNCVGGPATSCTSNAECATGLTCEKNFCRKVSG